MKILLINKFLFPKGGSETYIFKLGEYLMSLGHEVQYFGMEHSGRCVGNRAESYTSDMDFHGPGKLRRLSYPIRTIYNTEARKKLRVVLNDFKPDVVHLNNFNYQLTPSVILETVSWREKNRKEVRIIYTAHDYQLVCPNHMCNNPISHQNCEKCLTGNKGAKFQNCLKGRCIHGSAARSAIGMAEAYFWQWKGVYQYLDKIICCSHFMKSRLDTNPLFRDKTVALHNFIGKTETVSAVNPAQKAGMQKGYVLYFGRFSLEKGVRTLIEACRALPEIPFVFAGSGEYTDLMKEVSNIKNVGFQTGSKLDTLIQNAYFSVCPSEWYENCPFAVMESQIWKKPVLGARIGGIPELVEDGVTGRLFESGNAADLTRVIREMWEDAEEVKKYSDNCRKIQRDGLKEYTEKLMKIYR